LALAYVFQNTLGALQCVLVYFIGRALCGRFAGLFAALFCACYGMFIFYDNLLIYTSVALLMNSLFFLFVLRISGKMASARDLLLAGMLLGLCVGVQAGVAAFGLMALLWISWKGGENLFLKLKLSLSFFCGLGLIIAALAWMNYASDRNPAVISRNTGFNFYLGNNGQATGSYYTPDLFTANQEALYNEARGSADMRSGKTLSPGEVSRYWFGESAGFIVREPLKYARLLWRKAALTFSARELSCDPEYKFASAIPPVSWRFAGDLSLIMPLALIGFFLAPGLGKKVRLLYLAVLGFALNTIVFFVISKNRVMMVPYLCVFAGISLYYFRAWVKSRNYLKPLVFVAAFGILYFFFHSFSAYADRLPAGPNSASEHFRQGLECVEKADYDCALRQFNSALQSDPKNPRIMFSLGTVYYELGDYEKAEEQFANALKKSPFYSDAYYNLGYMYNRLGRYADAAAVLNKGLGYIQDDAGLYFELACAYQGLGEFAKAKSGLISALGMVRRWQPEKRSAIESKLKEIEDASGSDIPGGADGLR
jgi:tetratricopeptide (TPR) repeat protein